MSTADDPVRRAERGATPPTLPLPVAREMVMERFEREHPTAELGQHGGNISRAATPPDTLSP